MASFLLAATFVLVALAELGRHPLQDPDGRPWEGAILAAASLTGALIVLFTEGLNLFHAIRQIPLALAWLTAAVLAFVFNLRGGVLKAGWSRALELMRGWRPMDTALVSVFAVLAILVLAVAFASPPNNVDALQYHMPRVVHWAQNGSLSHFATPYDSQNVRPFWAELAILNLRVLWGSDRPANLPQALCLIGVVVAAVGISRHLGGDRRTRLLAGALAFSVPMALLQASTPKNDVASSFWVMATAYFVIREAVEGLSRRERWALFVSVALAILTKGTGIPFVAALLVWYCVVVFRRDGFRKLIVENAPAVLVLVALNGGFWYRNTVTYGGPFGSDLPLGLSASTARQAASLGTPAGALARMASMSPAGIASLTLPSGSPTPRVLTASGLEGYLARWVRMLAMHFVTPVHAVNQAIFGTMRRFPVLFPYGYVHALEFAAWNHEMTAGNPLHLVLIVGSAAAIALSRSKRGLNPLFGLLIAAFAGLFLISFAGCIDSVFCMRYQLSFFHLGAPIVAAVIYRFWPRAVTVSAVLILAYAVPYVLFNNMRPVIGIPPWPTRIKSVFTENVDTILFAQSPEIRDEYEYIANRVIEQGCRRVGLGTIRDDLEYTLWRVLGAPGSGVEIEHLRATPATQKYLNPGFSPCALICTACGTLPRGLGLPLVSNLGHVRLYLRGSD